MQYVKTEKVLNGFSLHRQLRPLESFAFISGSHWKSGISNVFKRNPLFLRIYFSTWTPCSFSDSVIDVLVSLSKAAWMEEFLGISVLNFVLYHFTIARTSFYSGRVCSHNEFDYRLAAFKIQGLPLCRWKSWRYLIPGLTVFVFLFFIFLCLAYNPDLLAWERLDDMLSGRLRLGQSALQTYPLTLFGQTVKWLGSVVRRSLCLGECL